MRTWRRSLREQVTATLAVLGTATLMTGLVLTGTAGTAQADKPDDPGVGNENAQTCDKLGYTKVDSSSGSVSEDFGTLQWSGRTLSYDIAEGYTVQLCIKSGAKTGEGDKITESGPIAGPKKASITITQKISHIGYSYSYAPPLPPKPVVVTPEGEPEFIDECGTENDKTVVPADTALVDWHMWVHGHTVKVVAKLQDGLGDGYVLAEGKWKWYYTFTDKPCDKPEETITGTPVEPTVVPSEECEVEGTYTIPSTKGVRYLLDGEPIEPGTYRGPVDGVLTAVALEGYKLDDKKWSYHLVLEEAEECEVLPTEGVDVCPDIEGVQTAVPAGYTLIEGMCVPDEVQGVETEVPDTDRGPVVAPAGGGQPTVLGVQAEVPTAVDAGFVAGLEREGAGSPLGIVLTAFGAVILLLAGGMANGRRARGAHQH